MKARDWNWKDTCWSCKNKKIKKKENTQEKQKENFKKNNKRDFKKSKRKFI